MTSHYRAEGFIFRTENKKEADRVFSVFTRDFGRMEIIGKAIRKITSKLNCGIGIFSISKLEFVRGKNKKILTDAAVLQKFSGLADNPEKFVVACAMADILNDFIKGEEKDEDTFNLLTESFDKLNSHESTVNNYQLIYHYFFWNFIAIAGYRPEIYKCIACGRGLSSDNLYFSIEKGGTLCEKCAVFTSESKKINADIVKILRLLYEKKWDILIRLKAKIDTWKKLEEISKNYSEWLFSSYFAAKNTLKTK